MYALSWWQIVVWRLAYEGCQLTILKLIVEVCGTSKFSNKLTRQNVLLNPDVHIAENLYA